MCKGFGAGGKVQGDPRAPTSPAWLGLGVQGVVSWREKAAFPTEEQQARSPGGRSGPAPHAARLPDKYGNPWGGQSHSAGGAGGRAGASRAEGNGHREEGESEESLSRNGGKGCARPRARHPWVLQAGKGSDLWGAEWLLGQSWKGQGQAGLRRKEAKFEEHKAHLKLSHFSPVQPWDCCMLVLSRFSCVWASATPRTVASQVRLSMGFSRQEYWSGLPWPPPGNFPNRWSNPCLLCLLHWHAGYLLLASPGKPSPETNPTQSLCPGEGWDPHLCTTAHPLPSELWLKNLA